MFHWLIKCEVTNFAVFIVCLHGQEDHDFRDAYMGHSGNYCSIPIISRSFYIQDKKDKIRNQNSGNYCNYEKFDNLFKYQNCSSSIVFFSLASRNKQINKQKTRTKFQECEHVFIFFTIKYKNYWLKYFFFLLLFESF